MQIQIVFKILFTIILAFAVWKTLSLLALQIIVIYQHFAPDEIRKRCKCYSSCSEYTEQAIKKYGLAKGLILGYRRIRRCGNAIRGDDPLI